MARLASGRFELRVSIEEVETALGAGGNRSRLEHAINYVKAIASGTADGEIDRVYSVEIDLTTTPTDVDIRGSLASVLSGQTVTMADFVGLVVEHVSGAGNALIGGDANSVPIFADTSDIVPVEPGGIVAKYSPGGVVTTAGTGDILQLAASAGTVRVRVALIGRAS